MNNDFFPNKGFRWGFIAVWAVGLLIGAAFWITVIWAIIHFTHKYG